MECFPGRMKYPGLLSINWLVPGIVCAARPQAGGFLRAPGAMAVKSIKGDICESRHRHNKRGLNAMMAATMPCSGGRSAPPRTAMISSEDPCPFNGPNPSIASEKIFDHITEQNRPTPRMAHLAVSPARRSRSPISAMMTTLNKASIRCGLDSPAKKAASRSSRRTP